MFILREIKATSWTKCVCCSEQIRTDEHMLIVEREDGRKVRGERYCVHCADHAFMNNKGLCWEDEIPSNEQISERQREIFSAYRANGCPSRYFDDLH